MSTYPLNPTPNRVRNLEAYIAHAEDAATRAQVAAQSTGDSVAAAATSATNALKSAQDAAAAQAGVQTAATNAANSATSAGNSRTAAEQAAASATSSVATISGFATTASTAATNAANSAAAASTSSTNASTSATNAATSATTAQTARDQAVAAANAGSLRGDIVQNLSDPAKLQMLTNVGLLVPHAQCRLVRVSDTQLALVPVGRGNKLWVDYKFLTVPNGGVALANQGLPPFTRYYAYGYNANNTIIPYLTGTPPTIDPLFGHKVISGGTDAQNRGSTYLGTIYTDANGLFADRPDFRGLVSHYGKIRKPLLGSDVSGQAGTSWVEVNTAGRVTFLSDGEDSVDIGVVGVANSTQTDNIGWYVSVDGVLSTRPNNPAVITGSHVSLDVWASKTPSDGPHFVGLYGKGGGTSPTYSYTIVGAING